MPDVGVFTAESSTWGAARPRRERLSVDDHRRLSQQYRRRRTLIAYGFLTPNLFFFIVFLVVPILQTLWLTLQSGGLLGSATFVGLDNWVKVPGDATALKTLGNSLAYAAIAIPGMLVLGMAVAILLVNVRRGGPIFRAMLYFPTLAPVVVAALIWQFVVHFDFGALNLGIRLVGGEPVNWLGSESTALPTIAALEIWRGVGFWALFFLATLLGLPKELYQAAHLDGSNAWQRFRYLTLPLIRPTLVFAIVLATIYNLQIFDAVFTITDGGPANSTGTIVWYIYNTLFKFDKIGFGATMSFVLLIVILGLTLTQMRLLRSRRAG